MKRSIMCIDLKSFFASAECIKRNLDPFTTPLVVADISRGNGAMTLAVTPYLRNLGIESRSRVFTLPKNINIIYAKPRMKLYEQTSKKIIEIYKTFVSEEDIFVFSIDEVFIDLTSYLKYYNMSDYDLCLLIMKTVKEKSGITSTCGIGPNMFLAKVAMDTEAKNNKEFISKWTYKDVESKLQEITPLSKICGIGKQYEKHLNNLGIYKLKDIFKYKRDFFIKRFGLVAGNNIWYKACGIDYLTIKEANNLEKDKSISMSQILMKDYRTNDAFLIIEEMTHMLCRKLRSLKKCTSRIHLSIRYSRELQKGFHYSINISESNNEDYIINIFNKIFYDKVEDYPIRKVSIAFTKLSKSNIKQLSLFENKEQNINKTMDDIYEKYGPTTLLKASSLLENSTIKNRELFKNII